MKIQLHKLLEVRLTYEFKNTINLIKTKDFKNVLT